MNVYTVFLTGIHPTKGVRQQLIINGVVAEHEEAARDDAIMRVCEHDPRLHHADLRYVKAKRTDNAFWRGNLR